MHQCNLHQIVLWLIGTVNKGGQFRHIISNADVVRWQMVRLSDADIMLSICAGRSVAFLLQPDDSQTMQLADKIFRYLIAVAQVFVDILHRGFNIIDFFELVRRTLRPFNFAFNIVGKRGVISLNPCRAKTLQHVENRLQLRKQDRVNIGFQPQVSE